MLNHSVYFSGSATGLPPREFLRAIPVRLAHLVFDYRTKEDRHKPNLERLKTLLFDGHEPLLNTPRHFIMDENQEYFCPVDDTTDYLTKTLDVFPSGSGWTVRWETHLGFVTVIFCRCFSKPTDALSGETALACLPRDLIAPQALVRETIKGGNIDLLVIPHNRNQDQDAAALHMMKLRKESPYITRSLVFDGMAEVWMSFEIRSDVEPRPVVVFVLPHTAEPMDARLAGELIQILLQIEAYRVVASRRTPEEELRKSIDTLTKHEEGFKKISIKIHDLLSKKQWLIKDLLWLEDYLPILREMALISTAIEQQVADGAVKYAAAQAYRDLAAGRLKDLREQPVPHYPNIEQFLRHRLEQIGQTCKAISHWQESLLRHISQLDGLLRTRMEARQQYSIHCVHFLVLALTVVAVCYYGSHILTDSSIVDHGKAALFYTIGSIFAVGILLFSIKFNIRKNAIHYCNSEHLNKGQDSIAQNSRHLN